MAPTVRLTNSVCVIATDSQGERIADTVAATLEHDGLDVDRRSHGQPRSAPSWWPDDRVRVLCSSRIRWDLEERLHRAAARGGAPGIPVVLHHPFIRVGPTAFPGAPCSPCSPCLRLRREQLVEGIGLENSYLEALGDAHPGPSGVLPHEAELAARLVSDEVAALTGPGASPAVPGRVRWFDVQSFSLASDTVVGLHGCPNCGGAAGPPEERSWSSLLNSVRSLNRGEYSANATSPVNGG